MNFSRRDFLKGLGLATGGTLLGLKAGQLLADGNEQKKWNLVVILTDDQGYQDLGCFGSPNIKTPNIDKMAAEGMRFTDFYSAAPVCSPARAAFMTGCYPLRVGMPDVLITGALAGLNPDEFTIAEAAKSAGYATGCIGKWHLGHHPEFLPTKQGFDSYFGIPFSNDMMTKHKLDAAGYDEAWKHPKDAFKNWNVPLMRDEKIIEQPADQTRITDRYTDEAVSFIEKNKERPFFLYLAHNMPHVPIFVSEAHYNADPAQAYKLAVEHIDASTGRVIEALKKNNLDKNTVVIFYSDNGPWQACGHFGGSAKPLKAGKRSTYEGGMRVPCVMWGPGLIPAGKVCSEVAVGFDILPTFASLSGATLPKDHVIDGKDILPLMKGVEGAVSPHEALYYYSSTTLQAARMGKWKLRKTSDDVSKVELFDMSTIEGESKNINGPEHQARVKAMLEKMGAFDADLKAHIRPASNHRDTKKPEKKQ
jgi:arylsulfatase A